MKAEMDPKSLFSLNERLESLQDELLEKLAEVVDFDIFRDFLTESLGYRYKPHRGTSPF